ncbi:keratin, type II cytoskeletal 68 kDa, component IB-like [Ischnura elegans]|uniref:keratin, type II cytoskeletal 68 kDa, component IB-like n=1 Tax=Ischnura elegans TaxID=197161 RepID=UPI001ED89EBC|nr:keratin, type II cytoskeletal 68 kDa, component IB-like [Ischnura elegans]
MLRTYGKVLGLFFVLSVVSSRAVDPPVIKKPSPPVLVVPAAPVNPDLHGPVPVPAEELSDSSRDTRIPGGLGTSFGRRVLRSPQSQAPFFGASQGGAYSFGGNVNIPGVGGFGLSQSASLNGNFGFGGRPGFGRNQ